jgi:hypothetical protein
MTADPHLHLESCAGPPGSSGESDTDNCSTDDDDREEEFNVECEYACLKCSLLSIFMPLCRLGADDPGHVGAERDAPDTAEADAFNKHCDDHEADIDILIWAKENHIPRRAFDHLRAILKKHYSCEIANMAETAEALLAVGNPLQANTTEHKYRIQDARLRNLLPHSEITWESCSIADSIRQLLNDPRVLEAARFDFEDRRDSHGQRVFCEMFTGDQFREAVRSAPAGSKVAAVVLYEDETWLSRNGHAACKPLVLTLGNLLRGVYNQDFAKKIILHFRGLGGSKSTRNSSRYRQVSDSVSAEPHLDMGMPFWVWNAIHRKNVACTMNS